MKNMRIIFLLALCSTVNFLSPAAFSIDQSLVDKGLTITQSGDWILHESVTLSNAIIIKADNVTLNLNGHTIQGTDDAPCGIVCEGNECSIKNGSCTGFVEAALSLNNSSGITVSQLLIAYSAIGVRVANASSVELKQIELEDIGDVAIHVQDSEYVSIVSNSIKNITGSGLIIQGHCDCCLVGGLRIDGCTKNGLLIEADNVQCIHISVQQCGHDGIVISGNNVLCNAVVSTHNQGSGFVLRGNDCVMRNCSAGYNRDDGIMLDARTTNISILVGMYILNGKTGINNKGATTNKALYAQVYQNKQKELYRIINSIS